MTHRSLISRCAGTAEVLHDRAQRFSKLTYKAATGGRAIYAGLGRASTGCGAC